MKTDGLILFDKNLLLMLLESMGRLFLLIFILILDLSSLLGLAMAHTERITPDSIKIMAILLIPICIIWAILPIIRYLMKNKEGKKWMI